MGGRGGSPSPSALGQALKKAASEDTERTIRSLYDQLNVTQYSKGGHPFKPNAVSLTRLRDRLNELGWSREKQDAELIRLMRERKIVLFPESNQKTLRPQDRASAIHIGGQDKHLMSWQQGR